MLCHTYRQRYQYFILSKNRSLWCIQRGSDNFSLGTQSHTSLFTFSHGSSMLLCLTPVNVIPNHNIQNARLLSVNCNHCGNVSTNQICYYWLLWLCRICRIYYKTGRIRCSVQKRNINLHACSTYPSFMLMQMHRHFCLSKKTAWIIYIVYSWYVTKICPRRSCAWGCIMLH